MWPWRRASPATPPAPKPGERVIATVVYQTTLVGDDYQPLGAAPIMHVVAFCTRGSERYTRVEKAPFSSYADGHSRVIVDSANWKHHGELPSYARRVESKGNVQPLRIVKDGE